MAPKLGGRTLPLHVSVVLAPCLWCVAAWVSGSSFAFVSRVAHDFPSSLSVGSVLRLRLAEWAHCPPVPGAGAEAGPSVGLSCRAAWAAPFLNSGPSASLSFLL